MTTQRSWSGSPWESKAGYCRAIRVDDRVWVSGTAPFRDGELVHPGMLIEVEAEAVVCQEPQPLHYQPAFR